MSAILRRRVNLGPVMHESRLLRRGLQALPCRPSRKSRGLRHSTGRPSSVCSDTCQFEKRDEVKKTYRCDICPQREAICCTFFERKMVGIQGSDLATIIACLVGVLVVHIVWDADFCKDARVDAHVLGTFFSDRPELVREAVSYRILTNFDGESGCEVFAAQHAEYVDVPHAVPVSN
jgi:hypothetical protein